MSRAKKRRIAAMHRKQMKRARRYQDLIVTVGGLLLGWAESFTVSS